MQDSEPLSDDLLLSALESYESNRSDVKVFDNDDFKLKHHEKVSFENTIFVLYKYSRYKEEEKVKSYVISH
jgi:hypothetical protein